jgi:3-hydroxybutyryl-CoA dehydrogenase
MTGMPATRNQDQHPDLAIAVVGAGAMGRGIAQVAAVAGCRVTLSDARPGAAEEGAAFARTMIGRLAEKGRLDEAAAKSAATRITSVTGVAELSSPDVVVEAIIEDLDAKRRLFRELEQQLRPDAVLATNTSSLSVTAIAAGLDRPERVVGMHFFNPVPLMKLVEIVPGERTGQRTVEFANELVRRFGHTAIEVRDTPGFLVNHAGRAYSTEALRLVDEGVADPHDIDRILRDVAGFRLGPFELFDLTGLDVSQPVMEAVYRGFYEEPRLRPSPTGRRRLEAGILGRKSGAGFYPYDGRESAPEPRPPAYDGTTLWVDPAGGALAGLLRAGGVRVADGPRPGPGDIVIVTPWGPDVTTAAVEAALPPERTLGVDPLGEFAARLTLATSPATEQAALHGAHGALVMTGRPVTVIADSPGFVAQRMVACIVNLGCEIAQQRLARPADIDNAVRIALGYPRGPLEWGDSLGPGRVLGVLDGLSAATGDPRYRPSVWLSRRARLGLSLLREEAGVGA